LPTVDRIKWTSNRIIAISRSSATTFDTNKLYLRTDPNGILKIGGYQPTPGIWGIGSNILNHDDMWYPAAVFSILPIYSGSSSNSIPSLASQTWWNVLPLSEWGKVYVPKNTVAKIVACPFDSYKHSVSVGDDLNGQLCYGPLQYVQINGKDTSTQFRWIAKIRSGALINYSTGQGETITSGYVAPFLYNATFLPEMRSAGGYYRFPPPIGNIAVTSITTASEVMGANLLTSNGTPLSSFIQGYSGKVNVSPWALFTKLNPVTLSVGLTP
jgi:hypothetical protein